MRVSYDEKIRKFRELHTLSFELRKAKEKLVRIPREPMSLKDLIENVREQLGKYELTPEQVQVHKQHQALLKKQEKAQKEYQNLSGY